MKKWWQSAKGRPSSYYLVQFQELFSVCTATSGPGSTKMLWCIYYLRGGLVSAFVMFLFWRRVHLAWLLYFIARIYC
jgi:chromate transport protein ChrA